MVAPALTPEDMDQIGQELAILRPSTCVISRPSGDRDAGGAPDGTYDLIATIDPTNGGCRVDVPGRAAIERIGGARFGPEADFIVSVPRGTDVSSDDQIVVDGLTLEVVYAPKATSFSFELAVLCRASS